MNKLLQEPMKTEVELSQPIWLDQSPNWIKIEDRVYTEHKGSIYIGKEEVKPELLAILKEQAKYLETSQLYEIFLATLKNESKDLALIQSKDWDNVQFAKALFHCTFVIENLISKLKNNKT